MFHSSSVVIPVVHSLHPPQWSDSYFEHVTRFLSSRRIRRYNFIPSASGLRGPFPIHILLRKASRKRDPSFTYDYRKSFLGTNIINTLWATEVVAIFHEFSVAMLRLVKSLKRFGFWCTKQQREHAFTHYQHPPTSK